jgi:hypothetical protein
MTDANNCYKILNIDIPPLKDSFDGVDPRKLRPTGAWEQKFSVSDFINPDLISFLANNDIKLVEYGFATNGLYHVSQSGPTYEAYTDGKYNDITDIFTGKKYCSLEWNFSEIKAPCVFLSTENSSNTYDLQFNHTVWSNCSTIINTVTPNDKPILFNCQIPSVENPTQEQTDQKVRTKKLSIIFAGDTYANAVNKLSNYIVE